MASSSGRRSGSSGRSNSRKRVVIGAEETVRVRYSTDTPQVESERRQTRSSRRPPKPSAGQRLSESKRAERERRQRALRLRRVLAIAALVGAIGLAVWGAVALYRAPIFTIEQIVVTGAKHYTTQDVERIAQVPAGSTLMRLSVGDIEERLEADPWVIEATVDRDFPATLRISVLERSPAAVVDGGGDKLWMASRDAHWLGLRQEGQALLPVIQDVKKLAPRAGNAVSEPEITNAIRVLEGLSPQLRKKVVTVSAPSIDETALKTKGDVEIFVGEATEMAEKSRIISQILSEHKGVVYINVRVTDRPTWRGLESD